jgi:hypothetical protein
MQDYIINVGAVEEWQTLGDTHALEQVFQRAKSTLVNGAEVHLLRKDRSGSGEPFETFTTLEDLEAYRLRVFRYL